MQADSGSSSLQRQCKQRPHRVHGNNSLQGHNASNHLSQVWLATACKVTMQATTYPRSRKQQLANHSGSNGVAQIKKEPHGTSPCKQQPMTHFKATAALNDSLQSRIASNDLSLVTLTTSCAATMKATTHPTNAKHMPATTYHKS